MARGRVGVGPRAAAPGEGRGDGAYWCQEVIVGVPVCVTSRQSCCTLVVGLRGGGGDAASEAAGQGTRPRVVGNG